MASAPPLLLPRDFRPQRGRLQALTVAARRRLPNG
jgi:hypothetical protein